MTSEVEEVVMAADAFDLRTWFVAGLEPPRDRYGSFVEVTADRVRVANAWLPRRPASDEPFIPDPVTDADTSATSGAEGVAADAKGVVYGAEVGPKAVRKYEKK